MTKNRREREGSRSGRRREAVEMVTAEGRRQSMAHFAKGAFYKEWAGYCWARPARGKNEERERLLGQERGRGFRLKLVFRPRGLEISFIISKILL